MPAETETAAVCARVAKIASHLAEDGERWTFQAPQHRKAIAADLRHLLRCAEASQREREIAWLAGVAFGVEHSGISGAPHSAWILWNKGEMSLYGTPIAHYAEKDIAEFDKAAQDPTTGAYRLAAVLSALDASREGK